MKTSVPTGLGYKRGSDIKEGDIIEVRVYFASISVFSLATALSGYTNLRFARGPLIIRSPRSSYSQGQALLSGGERVDRAHASL